MGLPKTLKNVVAFLGNTLEENKVLSLMKVPQWCGFKRLMDAPTQSLGCYQTITQFGVEDLVLGLEECENSHTLTTTTTGSNNLQKEISSQIDNQNQYSVSPKGLFFTGSWS